MTNLYRGHVPDASGELMLVPKPHNFLIGEWDLTTLGSDRPTMSTSHPNPWNYLARVPIIVHAPQWGPKDVVLDQQTDIAALAPTYARFPVEFASGSGSVLRDADGVEYLDFLSGIAVCSQVNTTADAHRAIGRGGKRNSARHSCAP